MFEGMDPKTLKRWLILAAVVYFLVPFDVIPDFLGIPGRIDDIVGVALLAWFYRKHVQQYTTGGRRDADSADSSSRGARARPRQATAFDPYEVLQVSRAASQKEIRAAYRARMHEYHPDKVSHLGEELQRLAHEKSQEIQRAYRELGG